MVFEADLKSATRKVLMLCLADKANKDGTGAYPSQRTIARETHLDRKTIRALLNQLVSDGILVEVGKRKDLKGVMEYNILLPALRQLQHVDELGENSPAEKTLGENSRLLGENSPSTGGMADPKPSITINNLSAPAGASLPDEAAARLRALLESHCTGNPVLENALERTILETEAFDGRRLLIKSRFMADRVQEHLGRVLHSQNLIITTNPADMQLEDVG